MSSEYEVRMLAEADLEAVTEHMLRQVAQSGRDGLPIFNPFSVDFAWDPVDIRRRREERWALPVGEVGWGRCCGAWHDGRIVGHVEIDGARLDAGLHRGLLMMGIEREHHRRGLGRRLIEAAVAWCVESTDLAWIDLNVFAHNAAARALYRSAGFVEVGTTFDAFRVDGTTIDDIHMTLDLGLLRAID